MGLFSLNITTNALISHAQIMNIIIIIMVFASQPWASNSLLSPPNSFHIIIIGNEGISLFEN